MTTSTLLGSFILLSSTYRHRDSPMETYSPYSAVISVVETANRKSARDWSQTALEEFKNHIVSTVIG